MHGKSENCEKNSEACMHAWCSHEKLAINIKLIRQQGGSSSLVLSDRTNAIDCHQIYRVGQMLAFWQSAQLSSSRTMLLYTTRNSENREHSLACWIAFLLV